jgi:hypothetical protein
MDTRKTPSLRGVFGASRQGLKSGGVNISKAPTFAGRLGCSYNTPVGGSGHSLLAAGDVSYTSSSNCTNALRLHQLRKMRLVPRRHGRRLIGFGSCREQR